MLARIFRAARGFYYNHITATKSPALAFEKAAGLKGIAEQYIIRDGIDERTIRSANPQKIKRIIGIFMVDNPQLRKIVVHSEDQERTLALGVISGFNIDDIKLFLNTEGPTPPVTRAGMILQWVPSTETLDRIDTQLSMR